MMKVSNPKPLLNFVQLSHCSIYDQLCLEEALLRADSGNWCLCNRGSPPAIVLGISGKVELLINLSRLQNHPIPLIRRFSGGGTVVVDPNTLFITFICNHQDLPQVSCYPESILRWTEGLYAPLLPYGLFKRIEHDYAIGDRKFGGNAQYLCKDRWLHHSSLLWDFDHQRMEYLQIPSRQPKYRAGRAHTDFICSLKEFVPQPESLFAGMRTQLEPFFTMREVAASEIYAVRRLPHRLSTTYLDPPK